MKIYIHIENGVTEYPVNEVQYKNRKNKNVLSYFEVKESVKPTYLKTQYIIEDIPLIINDEYRKQYKIIDKTVMNFKKELLEELKKKTKLKLDTRPVIDTTLGFSVDGAYTDLVNFEAGKSLGLTEIRDADNVTQTISTSDWDIVLNAIRQYGLSILQNKWNTEGLIENYNTITELNNITL